jgi:hypothetical protein
LPWENDKHTSRFLSDIIKENKEKKKKAVPCRCEIVSLPGCYKPSIFMKVAASRSQLCNL